MIKTRIESEKYKSYLKVAWPCIVETLLLFSVHVIDTAMVSSLGENAVAAVGITGNPRFILLTVPSALSVGIIAVVARRKGEEKRDIANKLMKMVLLIGAILGVLVSLIGFFGAGIIIRFMGAEPAYFNEATNYFKIISMGFTFQALTLVINAAQRGCGNTKISMITNVTANVVNVIFNYLLIFGNYGFPRLGVSGAAAASALGMFGSFAVAVISLCNKKGYLNFGIILKEKMSFDVFRPVIKVGTSAFVEQACAKLGFLLYALIVVRLGTLEYATHVICQTITSASVCVAEGLSVAATSLVGQKLGAKDVVSATLFAKVGQRLAAVSSVFLFALFFFGRETIMLAFTDNAQMVAIGANILIISASMAYFQTSQLVYYACLRGAGDTRYVAQMSLISVTIIRPILTYVLCFYTPLSIYGAWVAIFIDQMMRFLMAKKRFDKGKWSTIKL